MKDRVKPKKERLKKSTQYEQPIKQEEIEQILLEQFPEKSVEEIEEMVPIVIKEIKEMERTPLPSVVEEYTQIPGIYPVSDYTPLPSIMEEPIEEQRMVPYYIQSEEQPVEEQPVEEVFEQDIQPDDIIVDYSTVIQLLPKQDDTQRSRKNFLQSLPMISKDYLSLKTILQYYEIPVGKLTARNKEKKIDLILKQEGFISGSGKKRKRY